MSSHLWRGPIRIALTALSLGVGAASFAAAPNILVIGDSHFRGSADSKQYADAAKAEMVAAAVALGGSATNVTLKYFDVAGINGTSQSVQASDFVRAGGGPYDIVVLTAVFGGFDATSVAAIQTAVQTRAAHAFMLFPDQCSSCALNIDTITVPIINAATGWGISTGLLFNNSAVPGSTNGTVVLNSATPLSTSFSSLNPMNVFDYRTLNNVPAYNMLYMPPQAPSTGDPSPRPTIKVPTAADVTNGVRFDNASALIVPRSQSFGGNGACIFTISDVNPLFYPGNPPVGTLGSILVDAAISPSGSCAVPAGSIQITKTLAPVPAQAPVTWPMKVQFAVTCDKPAAGTNYAVSAMAFSAPGTQSATVTPIPAGANCSVSEQAPAAIPNFRWDVAPAAPLNVVIADGVTSPAAFTNTLLPTTGGIAITKTLSPLPAGSPVTWPQNFDFTATCDLPTAGSLYTATASFSAAGSQTATMANVPEGASCTLRETPPTAPAAYVWDTPVFSPANITVAAGQTATSTVTNRLQTIPPALGKATLTKTLAAIPAGAAVSWPLAFNFTATCDKPAANTTYAANLSFSAPGSQTATLDSIPSGAQCTWTEAVPSAPAGYQWDIPSFAPATISVVGGQTVDTAITNTLRLSPTVRTVPEPVPSNTVAGLAAMAALMAAVGMRRRRHDTRASRKD